MQNRMVASLSPEDRSALLEHRPDPLPRVAAPARLRGQRVQVGVLDPLPPRQAAEDRLLHAREGQRRRLPDGAREVVARPLKVRRRHDLVDHPDLGRAPRRQRPADEKDLPRHRRPDDLDELLAQGEGHDQPETRQRHREARPVRGQAQIAVERQLQAPGEGVAVDHGERRVAAALDPPERRHDPRLRIDLFVLPRRELVQVHPRAERGAGAAEHDDAQGAVALEPLEARVEAREHGAVERVALRGPVERDGRDAVGDRAQHLVGHPPTAYNESPGTSRLSPGTIWAPGRRRRTSGEVRIFDARLPLPRMTHGRPISVSSTYTGNPSGSASTVTPPIIIPVSVLVSSDDANESLATPISRRTAWFTSSRRVALTTHAAYCLGSFLDATMIVFAECSSGTPYFSQNGPVSA